MKYLKNVLLATGLVATTLGMSLSANAGAIIKQDIYVDVVFADANPFDIVESTSQWIGSVTYNTDKADPSGFLDFASTDMSIEIGTLSLGLADGDGASLDPQQVTGAIDPFNEFAGLDFLVETFALFGAMPDYVLTIDLFSGGGALVLDEYVYDQDGNLVDVFEVAFGETTLGNVTFVPEPSALVLMLAGLGLLVRRKVAAK